MELLIAPLEALTDSRLSDPERRVLLSLFSFRGRDTNTVWPSLEAIAGRANIADKTRVSKLTSSLEKKGWLTKKKRGFTGGNEYVLTAPKLERGANLGSETKLGQNTNSNLDSDTNSNLDSAAKNKEQYIEQTIEQTNKNTGSDEQEPKPNLDSAAKLDVKAKPRKTKKPRTRTTDLDFSSWPQMPSEQVWADYKKLRQAKRAPVSQTVINSMGRELTALATHGITVDQALEVCITKGWQGLKADWVINHLKTTDWVSPTGGNRGPHKSAFKPTPADIIREQAIRNLERLDREEMERQNRETGNCTLDAYGEFIQTQVGNE